MTRKIIIQFDDADMTPVTASWAELGIVGKGDDCQSSKYKQSDYDLVVVAKRKRSVGSADSIEFYREEKKNV